MSGRIDPAVWAERQEWIHKQFDSGFSVARFCREHGLHIGAIFMLGSSRERPPVATIICLAS